MEDTNLVLVLKDGKEISVIYPERIGREAETPWLDTRGWREWNIDVMESLVSSGVGKNPRFIVGKWGTRYGQIEDVREIIPCDLVSGIKALSPGDAELGKACLEATRRANELESKMGCHVKFREFDALEKRVRTLEEASTAK